MINWRKQKMSMSLELVNLKREMEKQNYAIMELTETLKELNQTLKEKKTGRELTDTNMTAHLMQEHGGAITLEELYWKLKNGE